MAKLKTKPRFTKLPELQQQLLVFYMSDEVILANLEMVEDLGFQILKMDENQN